MTAQLSAAVPVVASSAPPLHEANPIAIAATMMNFFIGCVGFIFNIFIHEEMEIRRK